MTLVWTTDSSIAYEKEVPAVPVYAPFVAGGFFFAPALFLHEVNRPPRSELFTVDLCLYLLSDPANQATFLGSLRPAPALDIHGRGDLHVCPAVDVRLRHILAHCQRAQPLLRTQTLSQVLGVRQQVGKTNIINVPYRNYLSYRCRFFERPIHNDIMLMVINRVKNMLGYPEARAEMLYPNTILYR